MVQFMDGTKPVAVENDREVRQSLPAGPDWKQLSLEFTPPDAANAFLFKIGVWPRKDAPGKDVIDIDSLVVEEIPAGQ
jgi:hypothetical protein